MVVDRYRQDLLRLFLADDVVVEELVDLFGLGELFELQFGGFVELLLDDIVAEIDAFVTDVDARSGDELLDLLLGLTAERTLEKVAAVTELRHYASLLRLLGRCRFIGFACDASGLTRKKFAIICLSKFPA